MVRDWDDHFLCEPDHDHDHREFFEPDHNHHFENEPDHDQWSDDHFRSFHPKKFSLIFCPEK